MKAIIQRVTKASVTVGDELVNSIGQGLCILIGICREDTKEDYKYIARKILGLKLFDANDGKRWGNNIVEKQLEILCISQFTLYGVLKKNKPDFHNAMSADQSQALYQEFLTELGTNYNKDKIKDGVFGAYMQVHIQNDGPVTIELESPKKHNVVQEKST
ncbi:D-aminoacyl-tRNA deacylase [Arctopsyche grandis]|uniref:D-aminoacyl-tRNA deacylase n=1 Tax=Arctopsyche grandis TaxID=121162 RepID=UPI00406D7195